MADDAATILDIVLACRRIGQFLADADEAAFHADEEKRWATVSQLMIIGEAVRRLSENFRDQYATIPWRQVAGMRDRLIHQYDKINWDLVWKTATADVPALAAVLAPLTVAADSSSDEQPS